MNASTQQSGALVVTPAKEFNNFLMRLKPQIALALPKHMSADRMARLALTAFSTNPDLQKCDFMTIASSLMTAGAMGLEPGVNGAGFLVAFKGRCTFIPGWKGLVDLVSRSGRATVWTGAVFDGDFFEYALGDRPFVTHRPGEETDPEKLTHVYAIGRANGSEHAVIEVWTMRKVWKHRDRVNKQGGKHYSYRDPEMYARKVPLLQVIKYMPSSIEVANAIAANEAAESGKGVVFEGNFVTVQDDGTDGAGDGAQTAAAEIATMSPEDFNKKKGGWRKAVEDGRSTNDVIAMIQTRELLSEDQKVEIASWSVTKGAEGAAA